MSTVPRSRQRLARRLGWLVVATLVAASFAPSVMALSGAIYTSNIDGSIINENTGFAAKSDVYLTGGPCNGGSHLADGDYYFEVTSPNGVLLSSEQRLHPDDGLPRDARGELLAARHRRNRPADAV